MVSVAVKDFGPIVEGAVEIKPLTVFIGPNNSGKSHLATLVYALMQGGTPRNFTDSLGYHTAGLFYNLYFKRQMDESDSALGTEVNTWIRKRLDEGFDFTDTPVAILPASLVQVMEEAAKAEIRSIIVDPLSTEMPRCFGTEIDALSRSDGSGGKKFSVSLKPEWRIDAIPSSNEIEVVIPAPLFAEKSVRFSAKQGNGINSQHARQVSSDRYKDMLASAMSELLVDVTHWQFSEQTYYLPAARSGILQSHKQLASAIVRRSALAGIESLDVGRLPGIVADFISELLTLEPEKRAELYEVAEFLEKKIARGRIYLESAGAPYPEIAYETQGQKFRMHRVSSMVSELAPLVLYLKHRLAPGDLLIFEEPEAHLHPANQRVLAHAIVKMVRKGVKVMITTHSDYFLPQLSNFVRLSALPDERARRGYDDEDYLNPDDVGCYLFAWDREEGGSVVRELEVSAEEGVVEDEFYDVSESLYNEYVDLERAAIKSSIK